MKVLIFALGIKSLHVVKALAESALELNMTCVIGRDPAVANDYHFEIAKYCDEQQIPFVFRGKSRIPIVDFQFALAVGWRWMIHDIPYNKLVIFHDSLLPKYRGFAPLVCALLNREPLIGVSAIFGAERYDTGPILEQRALEVVYPTTIAAEIDKIACLYRDIAISVMTKLSSDPLLQGARQAESAASYSLWRNDEDYRITWSQKSSEIEHFIDCVGFPYLGASTVANGQVIRVLKVKSLEDIKIENRTPGKVVFLDQGQPVVVCGAGLVKIMDAIDGNGKNFLPMKKIRTKFM